MSVVDGRVAVEWTEGTSHIPGHETFPAVTEILPGFWSGGLLGGRLPDAFGFVLSLFAEGRYDIGPNTDRLQVRMADGPEIPDAGLLDSLARVVNWKHQNEQANVLVHCQAGLNRSSLVTVRALQLRGMSADEAITHVRSLRSPYCLCNPQFEAYLRSLG